MLLLLGPIHFPLVSEGTARSDRKEVSIKSTVAVSYRTVTTSSSSPALRRM